MDIFRMGNRAENGYAVWGGVWERGSVSADVHFRLMGEDGGEIPVQSSVRAYWPDGSVNWSAHTADAVRMGRRAVLTAGEAGEGPAGAEPNETEPDGTVPDRGRTEVCVRLGKGAEGFRIHTGRAELTVPLSGDAVFENYGIDGVLAAKGAEPEKQMEVDGRKQTKSERFFGFCILLAKYKA